MLAGDFAPGFYVKHFVKDMRIAREKRPRWASRSRTAAGLELFEALERRGDGDRGIHALYLLYKERCVPRALAPSGRHRIVT